MKAANDQPPVKLDRPRARKEAAKMLGVAISTRYRKLLMASGEDEIVVATADLAQAMYENVEFVIWALKSLGGMNPPPPDQLRKVSAAAPQPAFQKPPPLILADPVPSECTCQPLDAGIIGRDKHMASCPKYQPA